MLDIQKIYNAVYVLLSSIYQSEKNEEAMSLENAKGQRSKIAQNIRNIEEKITSIMPYYRASSAFVSTSISQRNYLPKEISVSELEKLYYQATTAKANRESQWEYLYKAAASGIKYYEDYKRNLSNKMASITTNVDHRAYDTKCREVLEGSYVAQLVEAVQLVDSAYSPRILANKAFSIPQKDSVVLFGKTTKPFPVTDGCIALAKQLLGGYFIAEDKTILLPCALPAVTLFQIGANAAEKVMSVIRAYVIGFLCHTMPCKSKIGYIDTCMLDSTCLGALRSIQGSDGRTDSGIIISVPTSVEETRKEMKTFRKEISESDTCQRRLIIYRYRQKLHDSQNVTNLQWICANAAKRNVQVIVVQETIRNEDDLERLIPDWIPSDALIIRPGVHKCLETRESHSRIATYLEPTHISNEFVSGLLKAYAPTPKQTRYFDTRPMHLKPDNFQRRRTKEISLLYGVKGNGERVYLDLRETDFSAYILGAAGSGKSNLLNVLITSAVMDYHPDDLELWLIDFGRTEFSRYIEHTPPHVRYVLVEKTVELICGLIDKLIDEMENRGKMLTKYHVLKIQELPENVSMPKLLVIIDEFGVYKEILSSDEFEEKRKYRDYMERLLKQGRKHGIYFIFANQSFTDVYKALPEEGSDQIGLRVTMTGKVSEMKAVLEIKGQQTSDEEEMRIEKLPKYQVLFRSREQGNELSEPVHVLYFPEEDRDKQLSIIDGINEIFKPIGRNRMDPLTTYCPRQQLCLSHDSTPTFNDRYSDIYNDLIRWKQNIAYQESDLLLFLGEPRNLEPVHFELLRSNQAENVLLYGSYAKSLDRIIRVVDAAMLSANFQKWPTEIWYGGGDTLAKLLIKKNRHGMTIIEQDKLATRIKELRYGLESGNLNKRLIVVTGVSSLVSTIKYELEERSLFGKKSEMDDIGFQKIRELMANGGVTENQSIERDELEDVTIYLGQLLKFCPRHSVHFLFIVQKESELHDANITINHFSHFAAFSSGLSDTQYFQLKRRVDRLSSEEMFGCLTGNGEFTAYAPFA